MNNANAVGSFNAINTTSGNIALTNNAVLNVTGINNTAAAGSVTVSNGTALGITGAIAAAGGGAISLTATGAAITETGTGLISTTGLLTTNSYSGTALNGANSVGSLSATNIMINDFSFSNSTPAAYFYINGISNVGGNITVNNAGSVMGITGTISGSAAINLTNTGASGGIQEFGGKILTTGMLTTNNASASGTNLNNGGTNMIGTFKATDAGLVFLQNGTALNLAGVSAGGGVLISTNSGGITVSGPVTASTSTVSLQGFGITNNSTITGGLGVTLTAGYSGFAPVGTLTNTTGIITNGGGASTGAINLTGDKMALTGGTITAGAGAVTINNVTMTDAIDLGSTTDVANLTLELSNAELGTISTTGLMSIGNASNSGAITVSAPLNLTYQHCAGERRRRHCDQRGDHRHREESDARYCRCCHANGNNHRCRA